MFKPELTKQELDVVVALMDSGVKATGLQAVRHEVISVLAKFAEAVNQHNKRTEEDAAKASAVETVTEVVAT